MFQGAVVLLYSGSSPNGHSHKPTAPLMATFTKPCFSQLPYKLYNILLPFSTYKGFLNFVQLES